MDERILQAVAGNTDALTELLEQQHAALERFVEGQMSAELRSRIEPEDILQETYIAVFDSIKTFQPTSDQAFVRWLQTIAVNRLRDAVRSLTAQKRGGELEQVPAVVVGDTGSAINLLEVVLADLSTPSRHVSREEGLQELLVQLAELPEEYRQAITYKDLQGLSVEETAERLGRGVDEVRGLLYRGRKKLAEAMGNASGYLFRE